MDDNNQQLPFDAQRFTQLLSTLNAEIMSQLHDSMINFGRVNINSDLLHEQRSNFRDHVHGRNAFMQGLLSNRIQGPFNRDQDSDGLDEEMIGRLLKTRLPSKEDVADHDKRDEECAVCIDGLHCGKELIGKLDCGHEYHANCIKKWLVQKNCCPLCKATALNVRGEMTMEVKDIEDYFLE